VAHSSFISDRSVLALRGIGLILSLLGMAILHAVRAINGQAVLNDFQYFSTIVNWMILLWYLMYFLWRNQEQKLQVLYGRTKGALVVYIAVVSVVYSLLLAADHNPTGLLAFTNIVHHYLVPVVFVADYLLTDSTAYHWRASFEWLVFPLLYLGYALLVGAETGNYVYFFLDISNPDIGVSGLLTWIAILITFFIFLGLLVIVYSKKIIHRGRS
jgi:hypothetical protein